MSSYIIKAVLSNPRHPEYGQITIPFPIPNKEYDHSIELLKALELGDVLQRDCQVDEVNSHYEVLKRLEGQSVNVDELDYLAKRLDSFCEGEDAQFQGMAAKLDISDISDFINFTFCCQQATVITDFSDLKRIGKDHYMNLHGGCVLISELENLDCHETALLLIESGAGQVTPYGVVYDNGMKLEQMYTGSAFPLYDYDRTELTVAVSPKYDSKSNTVLTLPMLPSQLERILQRNGLSIDQELNIEAEWSAYFYEMGDILKSSPKKLTDLNEMCAAIAMLHGVDRDKLDAVVKIAAPDCAFQIKRLAENLELFDFVPDVHTPEEYGRHMIQKSGHFDFDENLEGFYDYEKYGSQRVAEERGKFSELGYVSYHGTLSLEELIRGDPGGQCQGDQGQQMM